MDPPRSPAGRGVPAGGAGLGIGADGRAIGGAHGADPLTPQKFGGLVVVAAETAETGESGETGGGGAGAGAGAGAGGALPLPAPPLLPAPPRGDPSAVTKRADYISWDEYFMAVAFLSAMRSKDPSTQVGACIVDRDHRIVGIGYNGFPRGCSDDALPWARTAPSPEDTKYPYVVHAEANAILNANAASVKGCRLFVGLFPCNECAKLIIQSGIGEVVYVSDKYHDAPPFVASRRMLGLAGVATRQFAPARPGVAIRFDAIA
jgi:dCMP deaminase